MATLHARSVSFSFGAAPVLVDIDITVAPGHRIGIVGPNGTGKSTLLRVLASQLLPDKGEVTTAPPSATVGLLPQEPDRRPDESVTAFVARRTGVAAATAELDAATADLAEGATGADDRYSTALEAWLGLGGPDLDARLGHTLAELGLDGSLADQATATLSGGQAARVSLAATLLARFDVFLLDEPTNDLDFDGLARLEEFLVGLSAATVVVSHDRSFLERVVTHVLELDDHAHTGSLYAGGWSAYLADRATAQRHAVEAHDTFKAQRSELLDRSRTQRDWSSKGIRKAKTSGETDKFIRNRAKATSEKLAGKAKATERAIERLEVVDKPWESWDLRYEIGNATRSGDDVASLRAAVVERGDFCLGPVDLEITWADRVGVVGANGSGKSTLLDAILGRTPLTSGMARLGPGVIVGELHQGRDRFNTDASVSEVVQEITGQRLDEVRSLLAKFGLGAEHVNRPARGLSPGERTRANLALFMAEGVNLLVLDEPTNHLDLTAIEQLESALERYVGTLLVVTHDRTFAQAVATTRRLQVCDGKVTELD